MLSRDLEVKQRVGDLKGLRRNHSHFDSLKVFDLQESPWGEFASTWREASKQEGLQGTAEKVKMALGSSACF